MKAWITRTLLLIMFLAGYSRLVMGQGCGVVMTKNYNVYVSSTSDGSHIYTSVTLEGSASCSPTISCPCNSATHTPKVLNQVGNVGGWQNGSGTCVSCFISQQNNQTLVAPAGTTSTVTWEGDITCSLAGFFFGSGGNGPVASYTNIQHNYPGKPLSKPCWISQFFDHVSHNKTHHAEDVDYSNSSNNGGVATPYGTPVYAAEAGTVVAEAKGNGPASWPSCAGQVPPASANFVKIKGNDGYFTAYVHVTPTVANNAPVKQGDQIGVTDTSGCQQGGHVHMTRKDPNGNPVNFTVPCVNPLPTKNFSDGLVDDVVPDNL
jgi:hypothetical protein